MRFGILGGAFDPPHTAHLIIAGGVRDALHLDRVLFIPYHIGPHRPGGAVAGPEHRIRMLELALSSEPAFQVDAREVEREGPSYTIDTLRSLSSDHPGVGLVLIVGSDQLAEFQTWREWETMLDMVEIAGVVRPGNALDTLPEAIATRITPVELPPMPVSSTLIRERVAAGESIRHLVPPQVHRYIEENELYRGHTTAQ